MTIQRVERAWGYSAGDVIRLTSPEFGTSVVNKSRHRLQLAWPWWEANPQSMNRWDGTIGFPSDPSSHEWSYIPWRIEPTVSILATGDSCSVRIPSSNFIVSMIVTYDPPADYGFSPRPDCALGIVPSSTDQEDNEASGFTIYFRHGHPIDPIEIRRM